MSIDDSYRDIHWDSALLAAKTEQHAGCRQPPFENLKARVRKRLEDDPRYRLLRCLDCLDTYPTPLINDCQMCQEAHALEERRIDEACERCLLKRQDEYDRAVLADQEPGASPKTGSKRTPSSLKAKPLVYQRLVTTYDTSSTSKKGGWRQSTITSKATSNFIDLTGWLESNPASVYQPIGSLEELRKSKRLITVKKRKRALKDLGNMVPRPLRVKERTSRPCVRRVKTEPPSGSYSSTTPTRSPSTHGS